jgi:hypothetical protein
MAELYAKHGLPMFFLADPSVWFGSCTALLAAVVHVEIASFAGLRCAEELVEFVCIRLSEFLWRRLMHLSAIAVTQRMQLRLSAFISEK